MVDEVFTDIERTRLLSLVLAALSGRDDALLVAIVAKLAGTDTVLVARRAYPAGPVWYEPLR